MSFKILADTFSVARDSSHFVLVKNLKSPRTQDQLWVAFKVEGETKFGRSTVQGVVDTLDEVFFDNLELDTYDRFENALKEINLTFKNLKEKRGAGSVGEVSGVIAVFSGAQMHLTQAGDAEAYLVRKGKLTHVSEGLSSKSPDLFVNIASGDLLPEDKVLFATSRLLRLATHTQLVQMCKEGVVEAIDSIRELILGDNETSIGVACINTKPTRRSGGATQNSGDEPGLLRQLFSLGWENISSKLGGKTKDKGSSSRSNNLLFGIGILITILIISMIFLMSVRSDNQEREEYRARITQIQDDINTARTTGYSGDKETANNILNRAEGEAQEILEAEQFREEMLIVLEDIGAARDNINNTKRLTDLTPYADLSTERENVEGLGITGLDGSLFAYEYNALYEIVPDEVSSPKVINELESVVEATSMTDQNAVVFLTESNKIIEYYEDEFNVMGTDDETWKNGVDIASYGKFLYLLSPEDDQIYKYTHLRSKFSEATDYNVNVDLTGAISLAIDGSIYVLNEDGGIVRMLKGERQDYIVKDLAADLSDATQIFTLPEHENLYVLDPVENRIVVIQKETDVEGQGMYKEQIYFENIGNIQGFYVSLDENRLYILTEKEVFEVNV